MSNSIQLVVDDGRLCYVTKTVEALQWYGQWPEDLNADGSVTIPVLYQYPEGDCDTFQWPLDTGYRSRDIQINTIAMAMADERETGRIDASVQSVVLPDGTVIDL